MEDARSPPRLARPAPSIRRIALEEAAALLDRSSKQDGATSLPRLVLVATTILWTTQVAGVVLTDLLIKWVGAARRQVLHVVPLVLAIDRVPTRAGVTHHS